MNKIFPSAAAALDGIVHDGQLFAVGGAWLLAALLPYWRPPARNLVPVRSYARRAA